MVHMVPNQRAVRRLRWSPFTAAKKGVQGGARAPRHRDPE